MIGSHLLSQSNKLCKKSDLDATRRLEELQSEFTEAPPIFVSLMMNYRTSFQILDEFIEGFDSFVVETDRFVEPYYQINVPVV